MAVNRVTTSKGAAARPPAPPREISREEVREVLWLLADVITGLKRSGGHEIPEECRTPFESGSLGLTTGSPLGPPEPLRFQHRTSERPSALRGPFLARYGHDSERR